MVVINQHKSIFQMRSWMSTLWVQSLAVCLWRSDTSEEAVPQAEPLHLRLFFLLPSPFFSLCCLWEHPQCAYITTYQLIPPSCCLCPESPASVCAPGALSVCLSLQEYLSPSLCIHVWIYCSCCPLPSPDTLLNVRLRHRVGAEGALRLTVFCR